MSAKGTLSNRIGYARVSSVGQNLDSQMDALRTADCEKIFTDNMTGSRLDRPGWEQMMAYVRPGDTPVVTELSRMMRSCWRRPRCCSNAGSSWCRCARASIPLPLWDAASYR